MTNATFAFAVALLGWAPLVVLLAWRLRRAEYLAQAQARALDAHDERLITLERDSEEARTAYFKTAATVEDHGDRLDHVEQYTPEP